MSKQIKNLLLADDDLDDCTFFKDALEELKVSATLSTVNNGVELMNFLLAHVNNLPDIIFLDLNMPLKTGLECLSEIKENNRLKYIPVIIFSTSLNINVTNLVYEKGAQYYIRKPGEFSKLKKVINDALMMSSIQNLVQPEKEKFVIYF